VVNELLFTHAFVIGNAWVFTLSLQKRAPKTEGSLGTICSNSKMTDLPQSVVSVIPQIPQLQMQTCADKNFLPLAPEKRVGDDVSPSPSNQLPLADAHTTYDSIIQHNWVSELPGYLPCIVNSTFPTAASSARFQVLFSFSFSFWCAMDIFFFSFSFYFYFSSFVPFSSSVRLLKKFAGSG
jgi:hypothetical protein